MLKKKLSAKLKSRAGETIGETLVATLIAALSLLMLAGAITAASNVVTRSKAAMTQYYEEDGKLAAMKGTKPGTTTITLTNTANVGADSVLTVPSHNVTYNNNDRLGATAVINYTVSDS